MTLTDWLAHCERLHPKTIDLTLERVAGGARSRLGCASTRPVITVAGTNGKGSTCAMLESIALQAGYRVGAVHQAAPGALRGALPHRRRRGARPRRCVPHFEAVEAARERHRADLLRVHDAGDPAAAVAGARSTWSILEVGLGGRLDAVNAIDTDCALITSIDIDHVEYLGADRESIGFEKAGIMRAGRPAIVSDPMPPQSVIEHARRRSAPTCGASAATSATAATASNGRGPAAAGASTALAYPALRGANQLLNASGVLAALEALRDRVPITAQAVRNGLAMVELPGRFQIVPGQPTLVLDVAHNPHAVATLASNLDQMGFFPRTHAVFGAMRDKDLAGIIAPHAAARRRVALHRPADARAQPPPSELLRRAAQASRRATLHRAQRCATPTRRPALRAALERADPADRIVVFGSFFTVGGVLKDGLPRLTAQHLG